MATAAALSPELRAELVHGLSDASRQRILDTLRVGEQRVADIVELTGLSQPNASKHLRCLRGCGLVESEKRGREVFYSLVEGLGEILAALDGLLERVAPQMAACELADQTTSCCSPGSHA